MYILGLNYFPAHDTAACLIKNGKMVGFVEEERLNRQKHTRELPFVAIDCLCAKEGISVRDIDYIAIGVKFSRQVFLNRIVYAWYLGLINILPIMRDYIRSYIRFRNRVRQFKNHYQYKGKIIFVDHHTAHLAAAFLNSPFKKAAILSIDGSGLQYSSKIALGCENQIKEFDKIKLPHSIGLLYLKLTAYLGFYNYGNEWKVMGLAPYGSPDKYYSLLKDMISIDKNGKYRLNMRYFKYSVHSIIFGGRFGLSEYFYQKIGPSRQPNEPITDHHKDVAAALQKVTEEVILALFNSVYKRTKQDRICYGGGVVMNSVINGKIIKKTPFKEVYIPIAPYDAGNAIGSAYFVWNCILNQPRSQVITNAYVGPAFSNEEIETILNKLKLNYEFLDNPSRRAAELISKGNVIAWFQGMMEGGARALGNRSILADPRKAEMKDVVNKLIKYRESFRPFAPSILIEKIKEYFNNDCPVPFMERVYMIRPDKRKIIPAVTHVDGSGRLQTVDKKDNPLYWQLIKEFENITNVPVVLNTSFNVRGEPIVCTPEDALKCFFGTGLDYLIIGNFLVSKK